MTAHPAAYLRRSYVDPDSPGDISREAQRATIQRLAVADGHNGDVVEYDDWGISADIAKTAKRTAYSRLLADMEAGKVSAVYAFDVDRLYRDPRDLIRLQDAAQAHGVRIVTTAGPLAVGEGDDPSAEAFAFIGAVFGRLELQKSKKRARAAREARRERGDRFGHPPFGYKHVRGEKDCIIRVPDDTKPVAAIIEAYKAAGSVLGACRLLEVQKIPAPKGGARWATSLVTRILEREAPGLLPRRTKTGLRTPSSATLTGLVTCPFCQKMMTPNTHRGQLYCSNGPRDRDTHPRYTVREVDVLPFVRQSVDGLRLPGDRVRLATDTAATRVAIDENFRRVSKAYAAGGYTDDEFEQAQQKRDADLAALADTQAAVAVPRIDWDWPTGDVNRLLRLLIDHVVLDATLRPIDVVWRGRISEWAS